MSTILSTLQSIAWWFLSHPTATLWIVAILLGFVAGLVGIKLIRKDVLSRMGVYRRRQYGEYDFYSRIHRDAKYQIRFSGFGFTPKVLLHNGKSKKQYRTPVRLEWIPRQYCLTGESPHWENPGSVISPFWIDGQEEFVIGCKDRKGAKTLRGGTKAVTGAFVILVLIFVGVTFFLSRGTAEKVEIQSTPVVQGIQRVNEPRQTPTVVPTRPDVPVSVLINTDKMPETNRDVWDWLNNHLPNVPAPRINIRVPDWFKALVGKSDGGAVITMQGLPGYVLVLRDGNTSVVVRLTEEMIPITRTAVEVSNFTITAGDFHWKLSWDNTQWKQPVKGSHGKIEIIVGQDDELTINWKFSLLP